MGSLCSKNQHATLAGSVLDRVISQSSSDDDCLLYKLANYLGGGELIDAYNIGGQQEVHKLIEEQFGIFLYNNGKGKTITKTDYFKWFCRGGTSKSSRLAERSGSTSSPPGGFLDPESGYLLGPESAGKLKNGPGESPMSFDGRHSSNGLSSIKNHGLRTAARGASVDESRRGSGLWGNGYEFQGGWGQKVPIRSVHDPLVHWKDHPACWRMEYRGALGESLLHVLVMCDTKLHTKLATILVTVFPRLALDVVEGEEYLGASALHLAIAYHNSDLATLLVECGATINERAIGSFFLPYDQQSPQPKPETNYSGLAYLGEYPLAWAATCGNESVYNYLLDKGADPDLQDSLGNMVLHVLVINDKLDMYGYALRHPKKPARNEILNNAGLTPLTLACKLGRNLIFQEMLELSCIEFWRYSNITCSGYPLLALDTILPSGKTNWNSALMIILNGDSTEHLDMLEGGVIQRLLEEKWKTFARIQFLKRLAILFVHLLTLSGAVALRVGEYAEDNLRIAKQRALNKANRMAGVMTTTTTTTSSPVQDNNFDEIEEGVEVVRYVFEIGTLIGCVMYMVVQLGGEISNQGLPGFLRSLLHTPPKAIFLLSNFMIFGCVPFRAIKLYYEGDCDWCTKWEDTVLAIAVPSSWFFLMFFAGAVRLTGPFVTMIFNMITGDMVTFSIIYGVMLLGFSQTFYFLYMGHDDRGSTAFASYASTWMGLFHMTLGEYDMDHDRTSYPVLTTISFCIFMVMVPILLLNMLIAMMGNTYAMVIDRSEKEFVKQWANIVINLERAVNQKDAKEHLMSYSIKIAGNAEDGTEQRAVMVIKSKSKTKAKQRKGALSNWKRVGKCTITELRRRQCTGEQLRNEIFNREGPLPPVPRRRRGAAAIAAAQPQQQPAAQPAAPGTAPAVPGQPGDPAKPVDPFGKLAGLGHGLEPDEEEEEDELQPGEESRFSNALSQLAFNADLDIPDGTANYGYPSVLDETQVAQGADGQQPPSMPLTGTAGAPNPMQVPNAPKPPTEEPCRKIYAPGQLATPVAAIEAVSLDGVPPQPILVSPNVQTISEDDRKKKPPPKKKRKLHAPLKDKLWKPTKPPPRQSIFGFQITQEFHSSMDAMMEFDNLGFSDSEDETDDEQPGATGGGGAGDGGGEVTMVAKMAPPPSYAAACGMAPDVRVTTSGPKKIEVGAAPQAPGTDKYGRKRSGDSKMGPGITLNPRALHQHQQQRIQAAIDEQERKKRAAAKDDIGVQAETAEKKQGRTERQQQKKERPWTAAQHRRQELEQQPNSSSNVQSMTTVLAWEQDDGF